MEDVRLKNPLWKLHTWSSHGYLLTQKSLLRSLLTPVLEGRIKDISIDKKLYWIENKINVSLERVFLYILRAALEVYLHNIVWMFEDTREFHKVFWNISQQVKWQHHLGENVLSKKEQARGYQWPKNENENVLGNQEPKKC